MKSEPDPSAPMRQIGPAADLLLLLGLRFVDGFGLLALPDRQVRFGILDVSRDVVDEMLERMRAFGLKKPAAVAVGVHVGHRVLLQFGVVRLRPLGRSEQRGLFAVPRAVDDRPLGRPALFVQLAQRAGLFERGRHAARPDPPRR